MAAIVLVALYAIAPFNVAIPVVEIMDEGVLIPSVLHLMGSAVCQARCYADVANGGIQTGNVTSPLPNVRTLRVELFRRVFDHTNQSVRTVRFARCAFTTKNT